MKMVNEWLKLAKFLEIWQQFPHKHGQAIWLHYDISKKNHQFYEDITHFYETTELPTIPCFAHINRNQSVRV